MGLTHFVTDVSEHLNDSVEYIAHTFGSGVLQAQTTDGHLSTLGSFPPGIHRRRIERQASGSCGTFQECPLQAYRNRHLAAGSRRFVKGKYLDALWGARGHAL